MKIFDFQGRKGAVKIKTELCISTIISFSQVGPFPSQVKANKDHKGPSTELAVFLALLVREDLISSLSLLSAVPPASSGCWRALQQPACGNNESKSGSAILCKPPSARLCASESTPPSPLSLSFITQPPALVFGVDAGPGGSLL